MASWEEAAGPAEAALPRFASPRKSPGRSERLRQEYHSRLGYTSPITGGLHSQRKHKMRASFPPSQGSRSVSRSSSLATTPEARGELLGDRFIPSRVASQLDEAFHLQPTAGGGAATPEPSGTPGATDTAPSPYAANDAAKECRSLFHTLIRSEVLGEEYVASNVLQLRHAGPSPEQPSTPEAPAAMEPPSVVRATSDPGFMLGVDGWYDDGVPPPPSHAATPPVANPSPRVPRPHASPSVLSFSSRSPLGVRARPAANPHPSLCPVSGGLSLLAAPKRQRRKVPKVPFKVLDAPQLQDDFYLNLVDWSNANVLAVGLGSCVYLWSACTSKVTKLCDVGPQVTVTSVAWTQRGSHLAVGTSSGAVQIWDSVRVKKLRTFTDHTARVGTMAWNAHLLATGSRDKTILMRDVRARDGEATRLAAHKQEICGLKWSFDDHKLASGGNDNKLLVWSLAKGGTNPLHRFSAHTAAVKAIAWSPHQHGLLASGGGTADRCIRFWNTLTGAPLSCMDTGSQVCNLMWSRNCNEIVSTHGYSLNQIIMWKYPSMAKVATLTGHSFRVLYLSMSPDGQTIVTGAGDETLRFWNVFPGSKNKDGVSRLGQSLLFPGGHDIR